MAIVDCCYSLTDDIIWLFLRADENCPENYFFTHLLTVSHSRLTEVPMVLCVSVLVKLSGS